LDGSKEAVVAQVPIRQVDEAVVESLKRKAAARGISLEGYVREVLARGAAETRAELAARLRARLAEQPPATLDSTAFLQARRDGLRESETE
jgi:plasmid stability protein